MSKSSAARNDASNAMQKWPAVIRSARAPQLVVDQHSIAEQSAEHGYEVYEAM